jgi:hypothetical protein
MMSLTAAAAVARLNQERRLPNLLVIGALVHAELEQVTLECWPMHDGDVVLPTEASSNVETLRQAVGDDYEVVEILAVRNWQPVNQVALEAFPDAHRIIYGDAFGVMTPDRDPSHMQFHSALAVLPQPTAEDSLEGMELDVVPADVARETVREIRSRLPELRRRDSELAEVARGGVLVMPSYLTEVRLMRLNSELHHLEAVLEPQTANGAAVVIKPHPRSSLGQPAELARRLRKRGHRVRVLTRHDLALYPVELLEETARAVRTVEPGISSASLSLKLLYDVDSQISDVYVKDDKFFVPNKRKMFRTAAAYYNTMLRTLGEWDHKSALPPLSYPPPSRRERLAWHAHRPFVWRPTTPARTRRVALATEWSPTGERADLAGLTRRADPALGVTWYLPGGVADALRFDDHPDPAQAAVQRLDQLASLPAGSPLAVLAAVRPSSHAPVWETIFQKYRAVPVAVEARQTAEAFEDCLESRVDVLDRAPRLHQRRRAHPKDVPEGHVLFVCVTR